MTIRVVLCVRTQCSVSMQATACVSSSVSVKQNVRFILTWLKKNLFFFFNYKKSNNYVYYIYKITQPTRNTIYLKNNDNLGPVPFQTFIVRSGCSESGDSRHIRSLYLWNSRSRRGLYIYLPVRLWNRYDVAETVVLVGVSVCLASVAALLSVLKQSTQCRPVLLTECSDADSY